ncbi:MAG: hypothetical protein ACRDND_27260, partial [Streptosporangiaceae bacterium]
RVLAAVAGPAEPGDLAGQDAAHAAFTRLASRPGTSHAALRSAGRSLSERPARGRLPQAAALAVAAAGLGSIVAAFAGVLPSPIQHFAHEAIGAPPPARGISPHALTVTGSPMPRHPRPSDTGNGKQQSAASSDPVSDKTHPGSLSPRGRKGYGAVPGFAGCVPTLGQDHGWAVGNVQNPARPSPAPNQVRPGAARSPARSGPGQNRASPGSLLFPWPLPLASATKVCPAGTTPYQETHAPGR